MRITSDRVLLGVFLMLGFCAFAPFIDVASKLAAETISVGQITTVRYVVQFVLMMAFALFFRVDLRLTAMGAWLNVWRALVSIIATFTFVWAVSIMPIADALAIAFVEPFIVLILGRIFFNDEVGPRRIMACAVGFIGALFVIQPSFSTFGWVALLPVGTAFSFAAYMLLTREVARHMSPEAMQIHTAWIAVAICLPLQMVFIGEGVDSLAFSWPEGKAWIWLVGVGVAATVSHMMLSYAFKFAPSATLAPLHYLEITSAAALSYWVFGDFPDALTWLGIGIIVASGLYIIHRERVSAQPAARPEAG